MKSVTQKRYVRKPNWKGRFKKIELNTPELKAEFASAYYKAHQKRVDAAINKYRQRTPIYGSVTNEKIFVDRFNTRNFSSVKKAEEFANEKIYELGGGDLELYKAKHGARNRFFDLRKINKKLDETYTDYSYDDPMGNYTVMGYYDIKGDVEGEDIVLAHIIDTSDGSPYEVWEYMNKDEIGL